MESTVTKNKTAQVGKYSYRYVDIAQIHEYLDSAGLRYYQYIDRVDGDDYVMTVKVGKDGSESVPLRGARVVDATLVGVSNPAQQQGSALTYARRYSLLMAFGLATEDDDAQGMSKPADDAQQNTQQQERKASQKQVSVLAGVYTGENLKKLLQANGISKLEDISMTKASELIGKLKREG